MKWINLKNDFDEKHPLHDNYCLGHCLVDMTKHNLEIDDMINPCDHFNIFCQSNPKKEGSDEFLN